MPAKTMIVAGIMSGTSADGIDVAIVRIAPGALHPKIKLLVHHGVRYPAALRRVVLAAMNASSISTAELARLNWRLGIAYAEAVQDALKHATIRIDLVGCHGQTLFHQGKPTLNLGRKFACTWQAGEAQVIASRLGVPVVSNFRPADMLAGGQGAPLVPLLDYALFAHPTRGRVLQNIGGIANLTAIPAGGAPQNVIAFDTGPGNMVMDALASKLFEKPYDKNGAIAATGKVLAGPLQTALRADYFKMPPPRSAGREQFGREYVMKFLAACRKSSKKSEDALATATALTAESIASSYKKFVYENMRAGQPHPAPIDYIVSGGGTRNHTLMAMLAQRLEPLGCSLAATDDFGLPAEAKEAAAFALLAWHTWHRMPGNIRAATGAARPAILGQVTYV